jgi:hypothetical protein
VKLVERSPLVAEGRRYHLYVTNEDWRHHLFFFQGPNASGLTYHYGLGGDAFSSGANFETGRLVKWGYVNEPPRAHIVVRTSSPTLSPVNPSAWLVRFDCLSGCAKASPTMWQSRTGNRSSN